MQRHINHQVINFLTLAKNVTDSAKETDKGLKSDLESLLAKHKAIEAKFLDDDKKAIEKAKAEK